MERHIDIKGAYNIRDLGGYPTKDGGQIKWRKIFRAGQLTRIQDSEDAKMKALNLSCICDFRTMAEQEAYPDTWYNLDQLTRFSFPIGEGRVDKFEWLKTAKMGDGKDHYLHKGNRMYVLKRSPQFKAFFAVLLKEENYPILFHCTAGKDRTGFATFLLLTALEVNHQTILEDYLLTNKYLANFTEMASEKLSKNLGIEKAKLKSIFEAREAYLQGAMEVIAQEYGTVHTYLEQALGVGEVEILQLKKLLVNY